MLVDLRSDTVTLPTEAMRKAMAEAMVGDDVMGEDPTINKLQDRIAEIFQKEASLFFPTGTMSNLAAVMCWCSQRGSEVILGDNSHVFLFEQAGAAQIAGVAFHTVPNLTDGTMDLEKVRQSIRDDDIHEPITQLIIVEQTHNACGGRVIPMAYMEKLRELADKSNLPIHMDGARIWNAATALGCNPANLSIHVDSLSVCLSKGLGAPAGSCLVGSKEFITKARRIRKALGGGMRQVGILAAAGMIALDDFKNGMLSHDHRRTKLFADTLKDLPVFKMDVHAIDTNIIFVQVVLFDTTWQRSPASEICAMLKERGVLASAWTSHLIRFAIHRDIDDDDIHHAITVIKEISSLIQGK